LRYDLPVDDPRFGKLFRCPNNQQQHDLDWQERVRRLSNLSAFADKGFHNFQVDLTEYTPSEQTSLQHALRVARQFADHPHGWILLEGAYGCGKTHLAAAIGNARLQAGDTVLFITVPDLLDHLRASYGPTSELGYDETFDRIRNAQVLVLDDLGVENPSPWAQEKLFQLLNQRYVERSPTVITTNVDIDTLDPRIRSRMLDVEMMSRIKISAPDYRTHIKNERTDIQTSLDVYRHMRFDTFEIGRRESAEERRNLSRVLDAARSYAEKPAGWFLLTGHYGSGKTHLAAAIAHYRVTIGDDVMFMTVPDLLDFLRVTYRPDAKTSFDQRFNAIRNASLLVLDDLGAENPSAWAQEKLFQIIDFRYVSRLPTVLTTAKTMHQLSERIQTRLMDDRICNTFNLIAASYAERRLRNRS